MLSSTQWPELPPTETRWPTRWRAPRGSESTERCPLCEQEEIDPNIELRAALVAAAEARNLEEVHRSRGGAT